MTTIHIVSQENSSSGLPLYLRSAFQEAGHQVSLIDAESCLLPKVGVLLTSFHPDRKIWFRRREKLGTYSVAAWHRNTRLNGRLLDRVRKVDDKVLQVGGLYAPHPQARQLPYYLFFTYTMKLAFADGTSPWVPEPHEREKFVELEQELYDGARHIFVASDFVLRHLVAEYHVPRERITVAGMGVNDFYIRNIRREIPSALTMRCLFVGFTFHLKGGPDVLKAFALARQRVPGLELVIIGPHHMPEMDLEGVRHVGPVRDREALLEYYRSADLFLLPSRCDSFGFVFLEAMTQGLPCVGSTMNAMPEIIGDTGYVVEPGDYQRLVQVIVDFYGNPGLRKQLGERARDRVLKRFTWPAVVDAVETVMFERE